MKRKWSLLTLCLTLLMGLSLCLFAACGDGEKNVITAALSKTQVEVGETVTVTYSATEGEVSVTYKKDGGEAVTFTGTTFTPSAAGTYVFTFTAEGAEDVSKTLNVTEKTVTPATPVITASADKSEIFVGESVTFTYSATENAAVTVTYTKNDAAASGLTVTSGTPVTISEAGAYVFTFAAEGAESKTVSVTVKTRPVISLTVDDASMTSGTTVPVCVGTTVDYEASVTEGAVLSASYKIGDAEPDALTSLSDEFTFATVGTYVFTLTADGADTFTLTVTVAAHTYGNITYTEAEYKTAGSTDTIGCSNHYGCGTSITVTLPELTASDTWTESNVVPATCTAAGSKTMTCTVTASGGATQVTITVTGVEIPKIDHTLVKTEAKTVTCTEAGWNEYWTCSACDEIFKVNSQDAGTGKTDVTQVDSIYISAPGHDYDEAQIDAASGDIYKQCKTSGCGHKETLAELQSLNVILANENKVFIVGADAINANDFEISYTYSVDVSEYEALVNAAITNNISELTTTNVGVVTVTFYLCDLSSSVDVMLYASELGGVGVLSSKDGAVTSALSVGYETGKFAEATKKGIAVSFWLAEADKSSNEWTAIMLQGLSATDENNLKLTMCAIDPWSYQGADDTSNWGANLVPAKGSVGLQNGAGWNAFLIANPVFVTVSIATDGTICFYRNGVLVVKYVAADQIGTHTVQNFVDIMLSTASESGLLFAYGLRTEDLYMTNAVTAEQAVAILEAYKDSDAYVYKNKTLDTSALLAGLDAVSVYDAVDATFDGANAYVADAYSGVSETGMSVSFNLTSTVSDHWAAVAIGTIWEIDVTLACLDAYANTSGSIPSSNATPSPVELAEYFKGNSGWVTVTLTTSGDIIFYCNGTQAAIIQGTTPVWDFTLADGAGASSPNCTVAHVVEEILNCVKTFGCDLLEGVSGETLLVTSALDAAAVSTLYTNYSSMQA